jgi:hypothetical protein
MLVIYKAWNGSKKQNQKNQVLTTQQVHSAAQYSINSFVQKFNDGVDQKIAEMQKEIKEMQSQIVVYHEWIEITWISGRKHIFCVGKEGDGCYCIRLKSNPDIIKVRRYSTEYPYDLIDTQGDEHSQHGFFKQISWDKKTNSEKTRTKTLISWRLFGKEEFDQKCLEANGNSLNDNFMHKDDAESEKQWVQEIAAKKRRESD